MSQEELRALIQEKLAAMGLDKSAEEFVDSLKQPIKRRIQFLQNLQKQHDEIEAQFQKEKAELEAKYEKLYAPLYAERSQVVTGAKDVPAKEGEEAGEDIKGIPEFWLTVLLKSEILSEAITEKDVEVLKFLTDITTESFTEDGVPAGFKLKFFFASNPFFSNSVLEKTYHMAPEDEGVLEKAEGTKIEWLPGKDVTVKVMKKKPKGKGGRGDGKPIMKTEKVESFFNFFDPPAIPEEGEDIDEEDMEQLQSAIEDDYEIGATIKEKLLPCAVSWYTGEAMEEDAGFYLGEGDEGEDDEGDEGEGDEDEESDDDEGAGAKPAGQPGQQPPECKQQ